MSAHREVRRRRADGALRTNYTALRDHVIGTVKRSLRRRSIFFVEADLDAHYNLAWQALHTKLLDEPVESHEAFLVTVMLRRAIDDGRRADSERRAVTYELDGESEIEIGGADPADRIGDESKLRHFMEALKARLTPRELQAAALCYLQGHTRPEAARMLGIDNPKRMEKLMDGVSKKVGEFVHEIEAGAWCEARRSLMNAYAFHILDRDGPAYRQAVAHLGNCPACRRYVRMARGMAAVVPPLVLPDAPLSAGGGMLAGLIERAEALWYRAASLLDNAPGATGATAGVAGGSALAGGDTTTAVVTAAGTGGASLAAKAATIAALAVAGGGAVTSGVVHMPAHRDRAPDRKVAAVPAGATRQAPVLATRPVARRPAQSTQTATPTRPAKAKQAAKAARPAKAGHPRAPKKRRTAGQDFAFERASGTTTTRPAARKR